MTVPLDRLYHYIENTAEKIHGDRVIIYRFWPHGLKNINNLHPLHNNLWFEKILLVGIWCNDQEPLDHEYYKVNLRKAHNEYRDIFTSLNLYQPFKNLNYYRNIFEKNLLLHSEKRSHNLKKYQDDNELIPVYYWSHGLIARDWFRYAEHETFKKDAKKLFLIYNRAWSGTREYRLGFADLLVENNLLSQCQTTCNVTEPELDIHYTKHDFKNSCYRPKHVLENFLQSTNAGADSSADFVTTDYNSTEIEVVLETLFDDDRLHLTEKSLRPIACAQPFILTGTAGSLEYLRSYGFKTFDSVWDESYDLVQDPAERLKTIVDLMKQIANWDQSTRKYKLSCAQEIASYNRRWFFSQEFFDLIVNELTTNFESAFRELEFCDNYKPWIDRWNHFMSYPKIIDFLKNNQDSELPTQQTINQLMQICQARLDRLQKPTKDSIIKL
jgi:hypothetical protein